MSSIEVTTQGESFAVTPLGMVSRLSGLFHRLLGRAGSRAFWMLSDQAVVSIGNFVTANLLARYLPPSQYGAYGIILETLLFLNSLQAALVVYPLTIQAASGDHRGLQRSASAAMLFTFCLLPILGAVMWAAAGSTGGLMVGAAALGAMFVWQLQETLRRGLIAEFRIAACIPGDAIGYLVQAVVVYLLYRTGHLTVTTAFVAVGATSAAAMVVQGFQIGWVPIGLGECRKLAIEWWRLGRWMGLTNLATVISGVSYMWVLNFFWHLPAVAVFAALSQPLKLTNPVVMSIGGLIVPAVARSSAGGGVRAAIRPALRYAAMGAAVLMPIYLFMLVLPTFSLRVFYGPGSHYLEHASLLRFVVIIWVATYPTMVINSWLAGLKQSRYQFFAQMVSTVGAVCVGLPATAMWGVKGLLVGGLSINILTFGCLLFMLAKTIRTQPDHPSETPQAAFEVLMPETQGEGFEVQIPLEGPPPGK